LEVWLIPLCVLTLQLELKVLRTPLASDQGQKQRLKTLDKACSGKETQDFTHSW